jgi:hypothetical protein
VYLQVAAATEMPLLALRHVRHTCYEIPTFTLLSFSGILTVGFCSVIIYAGGALKDLKLWAVILAVVFVFLMLVILFIIGRQPNSSVKLSFKVRQCSDIRLS